MRRPIASIRGGDLSSGGDAGAKIYLYNGTKLTIQEDATKLGATLWIGESPTGAASAGTVDLAKPRQGGNQGVGLSGHLTLYNNAGITVRPSGKLYLNQASESDQKGGIVNNMGSTGQITIYGEVHRDVTDGNGKFLELGPKVINKGGGLFSQGDNTLVNFEGGYEGEQNSKYHMGKGSHRQGNIEDKGKMVFQGNGTTGPFDVYISGNVTLGTGATFEFDASSGAYCTVHIDGDLSQCGGAVTITSGNSLRISGTYALSGGILDASAGQVEVAIDFEQSGGTVGVSMGMTSSLSVSGAYTKSGGSLSLQGGSFSVGGDFIQSGGDTVISMGGSFSLPDGTLTLEDGTFTVSGTVAVTGTLAQNGAALSIGSMGALNVTGAFTQTAGSTQIDSGSMTVTGSLQQSGGTFTLGNSWYGLTVTGTTTLSDAAVFTLLTGGTLYANGGLEIGSGATLRGWGGSINGNVSNAGTLTLINGSAGTWLTINGNYTQTGTLRVGLDSMMMNSHLSVWGLATLGGTLDVLLLNGFMPSPSGMPFSVLYYSSRSGTFATLNLPALNSGSWDPRYDDPYSTFSLWVVN